jgi:UDP-N-acetylglucosamine enolpyruvyl transferase
LLIAGLCAQGQTTVSGVDLLRNAYGRLEENLLQLGAKFNVVETDGEKEMRLNSVFSRLEAF